MISGRGWNIKLPGLQKTKFNMIQKKIYFSWISDKPIPFKYQKFIDSWKRVMPDYEIHQITLQNIKRGAFVDKAIELKNYALAGHYARVQELYEHGGIYFDIDIEAVRTLDPLLNHEFILGAESNNWINNAVILSAKGHLFLRDCMKYMDLISFDTEKIELATGPIMFTNLMKKRGWTNGRAGTFKDRCTILTPQHFYPYHWDQFYKPECITEKTFTVHHWSNSWNNKVSIVIPCYKQAQYLPDAIESALAQTYKDIEIIVVNDGSPDNTSEVARKYKGVKLIWQPNKGLSAARNAGIKVASGGWILPLDADDKIHPRYIEKTIGKSDIVCPEMQCFGDSDKVWKPSHPAPTYNDFLKRNHIFCASLFKKDCWTLAGGYDELQSVKGKQGVNGFEDWTFWLRCTKAGFNVSVVPEVLFYYRKHGSSMLKEALDNRKKIIDYMKIEHPGIR
jgi:hypothetical protein